MRKVPVSWSQGQDAACPIFEADYFPQGGNEQRIRWLAVWVVSWSGFEYLRTEEGRGLVILDYQGDSHDDNSHKKEVVEVGDSRRMERFGLWEVQKLPDSPDLRLTHETVEGWADS